MKAISFTSTFIILTSFLLITFSLVSLATAASTVSPLTLPIGKYSILSNGSSGTLNITSIDGQGKLKGTINVYPYNKPPAPITGYFDNISGRIVFVRQLGPTALDIEVYTGYDSPFMGPGDCIVGGICKTDDSYYNASDVLT